MDSQMTYKWTVPVYQITAQTAGIELEKIAAKRGALKPSYIVEESRKPSAVLHNCFEWVDEAAAEKYRCRQAQDLLRNIVAVKIGGIEPPSPVRAFISIRQDHEYVPVIQVFRTPDLKQNMLKAAIKEMRAFQRKYSALESLAELMKTIDTIIEKENLQCVDDPPV